MKNWGKELIFGKKKKNVSKRLGEQCHAANSV